MPNFPLGFVPYLRPGSLLFTALAWRHMMRGTKRGEWRTVEDVYGTQCRRRAVFGERAGFASKALFGNSLSPEDVLQRHTLFGIYARALTKSAADMWAKELIDGNRRNLAHGRIMTSLSSNEFRFATADLRSCKKCIMRDMDESGFPSWHVFHILPAVHHCPYHGDLLTTELKGGGGGGGCEWKLRLPTGVAIEKCDQRSGPITNGYSSYLRLWVDLFDNRLSTITVDAWANFIESVIARMGSTENAINEISTQLTLSWGSGPDQISEMLGIQVQRGFVRKELAHQTAPARIAQKLAILTACNSLGIPHAGESVSEQLSMPLPSTPKESNYQPRENLLRDALRHAGAPLAIAPGLAQDRSVREIGKSFGSNRHQVTRIIESLPTAILKELSTLGSWSDDSWPTNELRKRDGKERVRRRKR